MQSAHKNKSKINWITEEEALLRHLKQVDQISSWKIIAKKINLVFSAKNRTSKQCRERYINYLRFGDKLEQRRQWTPFEDESLFLNFIKFGSSWSSITKQMSNRSQNTLKNRFYGILRKFHRKITKHEKQNRLKNRKPTRFEPLVEILKTAHQIECRSHISHALSPSQAQQISNTGLQLIKCLHIQSDQQSQSRNKILNLAESVNKSHVMIKQSLKKRHEHGQNQVQQISLARPQFLQVQCSTEQLKFINLVCQELDEENNASEIEQIQNHHCYTLVQEFQIDDWIQNDRSLGLLEELNKEFAFKGENAQDSEFKD